MQDRGPYSEGSSVRILWCIAASPEPVTVDEIRDEVDAARNYVNQVLKRLHRSGLVEREERTQASRGGNPYEYRVAEMEGDDG